MSNDAAAGLINSAAVGVGYVAPDTEPEPPTEEEEPVNTPEEPDVPPVPDPEPEPVEPEPA